MTGHRFSLADLEDAMRADSGFCLACGTMAETHIEPDARRYHCSACGANEVYGAEELLIMGRVLSEKQKGE